jgi:orotate phosphoribosyltransferase
MTSSSSYDKTALIELIHQHALEFGEFVLASGQKANFYLDCRRLTLTGEGANVIAAGILDVLQADWPDAVGGMAIGADPITAAVITVAWQRGRHLNGFIVRKNPKEHGMGKQVEGPVVPGEKVVMLEDVVTTGGSSIRAIQHVRDAGLKTDRVIAVVDREQGAAERFAEVGVELHALVKLSDLKMPENV